MVADVPVLTLQHIFLQVLCMGFGQQQMVMTRLYSYIINSVQQVRPPVPQAACSHAVRLRWRQDAL